MIRRILLPLCLGVLLAAVPASAQHRLFVAGDSTAQTYDPANTVMHGWAQDLQPLFNADSLVVVNHAIGGRSSGTFIAEERWQKIVDALQPGDWVAIQFGHNDTSPNRQRYVAPEQYKANLQRMCREAREKGAHPMILTSIVMRTWFDGRLEDRRNHFQEYIQLARDAAKEIDVPLIDMNVLTSAIVIYLGDDASKELYFHVKAGDHPKITADKADDTHLRAAGAQLYAKLFAGEIARQRIPLAKWLK
jgi:lysophospholipase L1-like esterase